MKPQRIFRTLACGLFAGIILAWIFFVIGCIYFQIQNPEVDVERLHVRQVVVITGLGALLGSIVAFTIGKWSLPQPVKHASIGALMGVVIDVFLTFSSGSHFRSFEGTAYGILVATVLGSLIGLFVGATYTRARKGRKAEGEASKSISGFQDQ